MMKVLSKDVMALSCKVWICGLKVKQMTEKKTAFPDLIVTQPLGDLMITCGIIVDSVRLSRS